jgi:hypothetical protein
MPALTIRNAYPSTTNATQTQALENTTLTHSTPPTLWLLITFIFLSYLFNILRQLLIPSFHLSQVIPRKCFTWYAPARDVKGVTQEAIERWMRLTAGQRTRNKFGIYDGRMGELEGEESWTELTMMGVEGARREMASGSSRGQG